MGFVKQVKTGEMEGQFWIFFLKNVRCKARFTNLEPDPVLVGWQHGLVPCHTRSEPTRK